MPGDANDFLAGLAGATKGIPESMRAGVERFGKKIIEEAQKITPVSQTSPEAGALRASGFSSPATGGNLIGLTLGFSDPAAVYVHENLSAHHAVGQAKFLEVTLSTLGPQMNAFLAAGVK